jgi:hypothetical protein
MPVLEFPIDVGPSVSGPREVRAESGLQSWYISAPAGILLTALQRRRALAGQGHLLRGTYWLHLTQKS